jgi:hypothetical protein
MSYVEMSCRNVTNPELINNSLTAQTWQKNTAKEKPSDFTYRKVIFNEIEGNSARYENSNKTTSHNLSIYNIFPYIMNDDFNNEGMV